MRVSETQFEPSVKHIGAADEHQFAFADIFHRNSIEVISSSADKRTVIRLLVERIARSHQMVRMQKRSIVSRLLGRERNHSTAFGKRLAFPHLRTSDVSMFMGAIGYSPCGIDFGSSDGVATRLVLLTLSPLELRGDHIDLLSRLVNLGNDKTLQLHIANNANPNCIYEYLSDLDI